MTTKSPYLSIIIPVYNEHSRIQKLSAVIDYLKTQDFTWEVLVVNDGSKDDTLKVLNSIPKPPSVIVISYPTNRGKGYAIKTGMLQASGVYRLFMDIDLSTPIQEFEKFKPLLSQNPILIATRKTSNAQLIKHQPLLRELLGKAFTNLSKFILGVNVSDFTCGFKCFSKDAAILIFSKATIERWGFDSEILYIATINQIPIREVPVSWENDPSSKVKFPQDLIRSLTDLITIKLNRFKNIY